MSDDGTWIILILIIVNNISNYHAVYFLYKKFYLSFSPQQSKSKDKVCAWSPQRHVGLELHGVYRSYVPICLVQGLAQVRETEKLKAWYFPLSNLVFSLLRYT